MPLFNMPDHVPNNIKTLLSRLNYSGENNFNEVQVLQEILTCISNPLNSNAVQEYLSQMEQKEDDQ